jgi:hypothetical protein
VLRASSPHFPRLRAQMIVDHDLLVRCVQIKKERVASSPDQFSSKVAIYSLLISVG